MSQPSSSPQLVQFEPPDDESVRARQETDSRLYCEIASAEHDLCERLHAARLVKVTHIPDEGLAQTPVEQLLARYRDAQRDMVRFLQRRARVAEGALRDLLEDDSEGPSARDRAFAALYGTVEGKTRDPHRLSKFESDLVALYRAAPQPARTIIRTVCQQLTEYAKVVRERPGDAPEKEKGGAR